MHVVVIGAGVGGLSAAAVLARAGLDVTVLEAQPNVGGCAATFYHQGYRFDAGATLAGGFYPGGPMSLVAEAAGLDEWPLQPADPAMMVHLPYGPSLARRSDSRRWQERQRAFGSSSERFWRWQERTADAVWDLALRLPPWPPASVGEIGGLARRGWSWIIADPAGRLSPRLAANAALPFSTHLRRSGDQLRLFVDAQLLISAQTNADRANALYAAAALDLPRRGTVHLRGGMGAIAEALGQALDVHGGSLLRRKEATRIVLDRNGPAAVEVGRESYRADVVVANLPHGSVARLLSDEARGLVSDGERVPPDGWGAFVVYAGVDGSAIPPDLPLHHQVVVGRPLGEGNSVFLSVSPEWDESRAPPGRRAITISTHTALAPWWELHESDRSAYDARKAQLSERVLEVASRAIPGLRGATDLLLSGTPVTFERFTGRARGWVGGYPQTSLLRNRPPQIGPGLWMVGDSIFPGQSTAAVALGGLRVARSILGE